MSVWIPQNSSFGTTQIWAVVHDGVGLFVAVGDEGKIATSPDGETWTQRANPFDSADSIYWLAYGGGVWVAAGGDAATTELKVATSPDGINWTLRAIPPGGVDVFNSFCTAAYGNGTFVIGAASAGVPGNNYWTSTDGGVTWNGFGDNTTPSFITLIFDGTNFVVSAYDNTGTIISIGYSADGETWTYNVIASFSGDTPDALAYNGTDLYLVAGFDSPYRVETSPSSAWAGTVRTTGILESPFIATFFESEFFVGSFNGLVYTSPDAIDPWVSEDPQFDGNSVNFFAADGDLLVAVGDGGKLSIRTDASVQTTVPSVVGLPIATAGTLITSASLVVGTITTAPSLEVPAGSVISQNPVGGTTVDEGTSVDLVRSTGAVTVPSVIEDTAAEANAAILAAGLSIGETDTAFSDSIPYGSVVSQFPIAGTLVLPGTSVAYAISVPRTDFDVDRTVISQYANSPTLLQLIHNMDEYVKPGVNMAKFYQYVWNVDTAVGFGLDVWGNIVGVSRLLQIPGNDPIVGFDNPSTPKDWYPMSQGRFAIEGEVTTAYELPDDAYRVLILTKALANIITTTGPALNRLLQNMFPHRGRAFVRDLGNMAMQFVFNFQLTPVEFAILTQSGVLPHPAGVFYSVAVIPGGLFGFQGYTGARPFNYGVFNSRSA